MEGGGDSLFTALSILDLQWKIEDKKVKKFTKHTDLNTDELRKELWQSISDNPGLYGINFNPETRREFQKFKAKDYPASDIFIQCFANKRHCKVELYFSNIKPVVFNPFKHEKNNRIARLQLKGIDHFNLLIQTEENIPEVTECMYFPAEEKNENPVENSECVSSDEESKTSENIQCGKNIRKGKMGFDRGIDEEINKKNNLIQFNCPHVGKNLSVGKIKFGTKDHMITVCALYDTCASMCLMSCSLAQVLEFRGLAMKDRLEAIKLTGIGGAKILVNLPYMFATPCFNNDYQFGNTRWGVMDDNKIPACAVIGFNFLSKYMITLDYQYMTLNVNNLRLLNLGRDIKIPSIQTSAEDINPKSEIEEFEDNICQQKIEIVPILADRFQEHLENLNLKQENLMELDSDPNSNCYSLLKKIKFIDGANSFKLRNDIDDADVNCQVIRYANQIEAVPDLEYLKQGNKLWKVIEELEETKESIGIEHGDRIHILGKKYPEIIYLWNEFNNPKKKHIPNRDKMIQS
ncbi:unnamed protein product, partial [Rotaria magnacalcarata]